MSSISDTSLWLKFFTEAGIPAGEATNYAIIFTDNRIKQDMLLDLNREYLRDMGISVMGDVIAILKHARAFSGHLSRQRVMQASPTPAPTPPSAPASTPTATKSRGESPTPPQGSKKSTPASRMLEHYVRKEATPPSPPLASRLGGGGSKRALEEEDSASNKRSSVFNRLGDNSVTSTTNDSPKITITMHGKDIVRSPDAGKWPAAVSPQSVFGRLVFKDDDLEDDVIETKTRIGKPLEYQGILKGGGEKRPILRKVAKMDDEVSIRGGRVATMTADTTSTSTSTSTSGVKSRLGIQRSGSVGSAGIFAREHQAAVKTILTKPSTPNSSPKLHKHTPPQIKSTPPSYGKTSLATPSTSANLATTSTPLSTSSTGKKYVKKIVKVNKYTGEVVSEEKVALKTDVFSRLGN